MKSFLIFLVFIIIALSLNAGLIITRNEMGNVTRELYHDNIFAEIQNERITQIWDFNTFELTLIYHPLMIYTTIDFERFKDEAYKKNMQEIEFEIENHDPERLQRMAEATITLFSTIQANYMLADSLYIQGYKTYEFHVFNGDVIIQKLWISPDLQERINQEVTPEHIWRVEAVLKENVARYFSALGIPIDPITLLVDMIESSGYIMQRTDYGLRDKENPERDREIDSMVNTISEIIERTIDPSIFTFHHRFVKKDYTDYHESVMQYMERYWDDM